MTKQECLEENLKDFQRKIENILKRQDIPREVQKEIQEKYAEYEEILKAALVEMGLSDHTVRYSSYHENATEESKKHAKEIIQGEYETKAIELSQYVAQLQQRIDLNEQQKQSYFMDNCYFVMYRGKIGDRAISYGEEIAEQVTGNITNCERTMEWIFEQNAIQAHFVEEYKEQVAALISRIRTNMPDRIDEEMLQTLQNNIQDLEMAYQEYEKNNIKIEQRPSSLEDKKRRI